ncbi:hypothetical protein C1T30_43385, partial [Bacillus sp. MBGLi97]
FTAGGLATGCGATGGVACAVAGVSGADTVAVTAVAAVFAKAGEGVGFLRVAAMMIPVETI